MCLRLTEQVGNAGGSIRLIKGPHSCVCSTRDDGRRVALVHEEAEAVGKHKLRGALLHLVLEAEGGLPSGRSREGLGCRGCLPCSACCPR